MEIKNYFAHQLSGAILLAPTVHVYEPGTTIPVAGLKTAAGADLANPFNGSAVTGLIQFAAPDGDYDLRVVGESRDFTIRIQCLDASDVVAAAQAARDDAQAAAAAAEDTLSTAVLLTGDQAVDGVKTFTSSPLVPTVAGSADNTTKAASTGFVQAVIAAFKAAANVFTKAQSVQWVVLADAANIAVDASLSNNFRVTLGGNRTLDNPTNLSNGQVLNFKIKQDGAGSRTLTLGTKYKVTGGAPTASTAANAIDLMSCIYDPTDDILICSYGRGAA